LSVHMVARTGPLMMLAIALSHADESPSLVAVAVPGQFRHPQRPAVPASSSLTQLLQVPSNFAADYRKFATEYRKWSRSHYLAAAAAQSGTLRMLSNLLAQWVQVSRSQQGEVILSTALTMGLLGASVSGYGGASWQRFLESWLGRSVGRGRASDVALKASMDFFIWAPLANAAYLLGLATMRGECFGDAWEGLTRCFARVMLLEAALFVPYSALAFQTIPLEVRPLASACVGAAFTIGLSMMVC